MSVTNAMEFIRQLVKRDIEAGNDADVDYRAAFSALIEWQRNPANGNEARAAVEALGIDEAARTYVAISAAEDRAELDVAYVDDGEI